ncbi:MAG: YdcF family protein [Pseudomonadota bacterium]
MRALARAALTAATLYALTMLAVCAWTFTWPAPRELEKADAILCLGGGLAPDGTLPGPVRTRIEACVAAQAATQTPLVVFTGGTRAQDGTRAGDVMAQHAIALGLPGSAALRETRSHSTLQNMLYALQLAPRTERLIVVTEAFHLPRAGASLRWAAWQLRLPQPSITLVMSEPVRRPARPILMREALALWFNAARAAAFSALPGAPERWLD